MVDSERDRMGSCGMVWDGLVEWNRRVGRGVE